MQEFLCIAQSIAFIFVGQLENFFNMFKNNKIAIHSWIAWPVARYGGCHFEYFQGSGLRRCRIGLARRRLECRLALEGVKAWIAQYAGMRG
jgi:hypothetical protein